MKKVCILKVEFFLVQVLSHPTLKRSSRHREKHYYLLSGIVVSGSEDKPVQSGGGGLEKRFCHRPEPTASPHQPFRFR